MSIFDRPKREDILTRKVYVNPVMTHDSFDETCDEFVEDFMYHKENNLPMYISDEEQLIYMSTIRETQFGDIDYWSWMKEEDDWMVVDTPPIIQCLDEDLFKI